MRRPGWSKRTPTPWGPLGAPQTLDDLNAFFADREVFGRASRDTRDRAQYLLGWSYLENGDAFAASRELRKVDLPWAGRLADAVDVRDRLPHKSPLLAGALSVVVPGLGHVYLGQPLIGVAALGWNGLFTAAAVDTAIHKLYGVTAVLGGLELLWYGGAILGAVSGAYKYNRDAELNHEEELKRVYDSAPSSSPPREPAIEPTPQSEKSPPSSSLEAARRASATAFLRASPSRASSMVTSRQSPSRVPGGTRRGQPDRGVVHDEHRPTSLQRSTKAVAMSGLAVGGGVAMAGRADSRVLNRIRFAAEILAADRHPGR